MMDALPRLGHVDVEMSGRDGESYRDLITPAAAACSKPRRGTAQLGWNECQRCRRAHEEDVVDRSLNDILDSAGGSPWAACQVAYIRAGYLIELVDVGVSLPLS